MTLALRYSAAPDSPLSRWDARWKLAAILIAVAGIATLDNLVPSLAAFAFTLIMLALSRLPWRWMRVRLGLFAFASLPFVAILPLTMESDGSNLWGISFSEHGLRTGIAIFCRCIAIGALSLLLVGTASLHHSIAAAHKLKVPGLLVLLALLAYRYAYLLGDELRRLRVALRVRGFKTQMNRHGYRTLGHVTGAVLVRGADRAEHVAQAMRCRGFDGHFHTLTAFRTHFTDVVSFLLMVVAAIMLVLWDRLGFS